MGYKSTNVFILGLIGAERVKVAHLGKAHACAAVNKPRDDPHCKL